MDIKHLKLQRLMIKYPNINQLVNIVNNLSERTFKDNESTFYYYDDKMYFEIDYTFKGLGEITIYFDWSIVDMFNGIIKYQDMDIFMREILSNLTDWKDLNNCKYGGRALFLMQKTLEKDEEYYK